LPENPKFRILHQHKTKAIMTNELLIFAAKVFGVGAAFFVLSAIIYYFIAKSNVTYPKETFFYWILIPWVIACRFASAIIDQHFPETDFWPNLLYNFLLLLPFLYFVGRVFISKLPSEQIKDKSN